jgi:ubiquinone/menaquinone biosynthesis C-methylase UbiE
MKKRQQELIDYYEERASHYDEVYSGKSPDVPEPHVYIRDVERISDICTRFGRGHLIDIGCGTCYWLPHYAKNCREVTLVDESRNMLLACQKRTNELPSDIDIHFIKGNFFHLRFLSKIFDTALIAFLISHLIEEDEQLFFKKIAEILKPKADILWIDGSWSSVRRKYREKEGLQQRTLTDGQSFTIFKRYFGEQDIKVISRRYSLLLRSLYMGDVFFAAHLALRH